MAHGVDKDEFLYDLDNLTQMMETSKILDSYETTGARPKKAKAKRTSSKATGESKAKPSSDTPPEPSITASLELEKLKNQNLKLQLEIRKAELELARLKERPSTEPSSTAMDVQSPCLLENAITSTPAQSSMTTGLPTLTQLRDKKKPGATLPHNYVFSSKGTLTYESLDIPDFIYGFLEFYKEQSPTCKQALLKHLQLLMERAATYTCRVYAVSTLPLPQLSSRGGYRGQAVKPFARERKPSSAIRICAPNPGLQARSDKFRRPRYRVEIGRKRNPSVEIGITPGNVLALLLAPLIAQLIDVAFAIRATTQCYTAPSADFQSQLPHHQELFKIKPRSD